MSVSVRIVAGVALLIAACGGALGPAGVSSPSPSRVVDTRSLFPAPSASPGVVVVTRASDGQGVDAHVGDEIQIALGEQYEWKLDPPDGAVLAQPFQTFLLRQGVQALWLAKSAGRSTIRAVGAAACSTGQPCPSPALFTATVNVSP